MDDPTKWIPSYPSTVISFGDTVRVEGPCWVLIGIVNNVVFINDSEFFRSGDFTNYGSFENNGNFGIAGVFDSNSDFVNNFFIFLPKYIKY